MISLSSIQQDLSEAMKSRDQLKVEVLRSLKTRVQNEQIASMGELSEAQIAALVRSEIKRRKEAATAFQTGDRAEMAERELAEAEILSAYVPAGPSNEEILKTIDSVIAENNFEAKDFGSAMGKLKGMMPNADGAELSKLLKEKLK